MLHAAAMLLGIFVFALVLIGRGASAEVMACAGVLALACTAFALRFGGAGRTAFSAPQVLPLALSWSGGVVRGAFATMRAAAAADVTLKPALVRVKTRAANAFEQAVFTEMLSAPPGVVAVEADAEGVLIHVNDEDGIDAVDIGALEQRVLSTLTWRNA